MVESAWVRAQNFEDASKAESIGEAVQRWSRTCPDAVALMAPNREPLSWGALYALLGSVEEALARAGIGRIDRVQL